MIKVTLLKKIAISFSLIMLISLVLQACAQNRLPKKERDFVDMVGIPAENINDPVELTLPDIGNDFTFGHPVLLLLRNRSHDTLIFPADYGAALYVYNEENKLWIEIDNSTVYPHAGDRLIDPVGKDSTGEVMFSVYPDTQGMAQPTVIRVLVVGQDEQAGSADDTLVGAYLDITLSP